MPSPTFIKAAAGLQCGFGDFLGPELLNDIKNQGFTILRLDIQEVSPQKGDALAQEVIDAGMQPLCIVRYAEQLKHLPKGTLAELGNEPDISSNKWIVESYTREAYRCVEEALKLDMRLYLGAVSNLHKRGFDFLQKLPWNSWPSACCSVHRYPDGNSPLNAHKGSSSREEEIKRLRDIIGYSRPIAITEVGYHDTQNGWSPEAVANHMEWERKFFSNQGIEIVVAYQLNDGNDSSIDAHFGFRNSSYEWKPVAKSFTEAV